MYPIEGGFGMESGGQHLITEICQAARSHGRCALASNGSTGRACKHQQVLLCSHGRKYHHTILTEEEEIETDKYRVTTYIGDKKNARGSNGSGKALQRRNSTLRNTRCTCSAKIVIPLDKLSFHLVCGLGDKTHLGRPPMAHVELKNCKRYLDVATLENESTSCISCLLLVYCVLMVATFDINVATIFVMSRMTKYER